MVRHSFVENNSSFSSKRKACRPGNDPDHHERSSGGHMLPRAQPASRRLATRLRLSEVCLNSDGVVKWRNIWRGGRAVECGGLENREIVSENGSLLCRVGEGRRTGATRNEAISGNYVATVYAAVELPYYVATRLKCLRPPTILAAAVHLQTPTAT